MNNSTKDEIEGSMQEAKGSVKEKAGQVTNRPALAAEGKAEKIAGRLQKEVGQIEEVLELGLRRIADGLYRMIRVACTNALPGWGSCCRGTLAA
jgi:uncharacterized protein YjbJ (UPF0337 family)